jgi:hypothetical protein
MHLQQGPPIAENETTTHRTHRTSGQGLFVFAHTGSDWGRVWDWLFIFLGYWVKEGVGLVVHFSLEDVAKINTP